MASPESLSQIAPAAESAGSYEPLFNFDLEPYNMALEIVAEALEKLADTMEPLDLPLPLVGPGYYLEIQVKSLKNPGHGGVPFSQINAVNIEGGQAPPVTQIEIILPGESAAHETIRLPADSLSASALPITIPESTSSSASEAAAVSPVTPASEPAQSVSDTSAAIEVSAAPLPITTSELLPPVLVGTESANAPLAEASASAANMISNAIGHLYNQGAFDGQASVSAVLPIPGPSSVASEAASAAVAGTETALLVASDLSLALPPSSVDVATPSSAGTNELASVIGGTYESSVALQEQSLSLSLAVGISFSGSSAIVVPESAFMPTAAPSQEGSAATGPVGVIPTLSQPPPIMIDPPMLSPEVVPSGSASSSELPLGSALASDPLLLGSAEAGSSSVAPLDLLFASSTGSDMPATSSAVAVGAESPLVTASVSAPALASAPAPASADETADNDSSMTMASAPLPFPPFGGPQNQQQDGLSSAASIAAASSSAPELAVLPAASSSDLVETIDIVSASNDNELESSIDAILHSVIEDYKTESIPKAAVGFALIHPRRQAAANARY
ncbi:hypothetical protein GGI02_001032 [Coemansia sp. RSA 2322]|nr:hypothetical protein GGI02_001032 [Coemansia sp. RSA 2322]